MGYCTLLTGSEAEVYKTQQVFLPICLAMYQLCVVKVKYLYFASIN